MRYGAKTIPVVTLLIVGAAAVPAGQIGLPSAAAKEGRRVAEAYGRSEALVGICVARAVRTIAQAQRVRAFAQFLSDIHAKQPALACIPPSDDSALLRQLFQAAGMRAFLTSVQPLRAGDAPGDMILGAANQGLDLLEYLAQCRKAAGLAPVIVVLQAGGDGKVLRTPTPEELRVSTWLALAAGAKGIIYYDYASLVDRHLEPVDGRAEEIARLSRAVNELTPALLDMAPCESFARAPEGTSVACFTTHDGRPLLIVVNRDVSMPARPVIKLDAEKLGQPWEAQDVISRLALKVRHEGDVLEVSPPLAPGGGAALVIRGARPLTTTQRPPEKPFGKLIPFGVWYVPGVPPLSDGSKHAYRRGLAHMTDDLGVNFLLACDTPFVEAGELLDAARREGVKVILHVRELAEALFPGDG